MNDPDDLPDAQRPFFWKLAHVAPAMGLTPDLMVSAIEAGQLPISMKRFGLRGQVYLARADVLAYLRSVQATAGATS